MAGDWIKMRGALLDHPKTIAIARALQSNQDFRDWLTPSGGGELNGQIASDSALRCVTVALLMKIWSGSREHGTFVGNDLHLRYSEVEDLDQMAGVPGVGGAMAKVRWVIESPDGEGIILPNFKEFNVPMTPAEKQSAYRKRQSQGVTEALPRSGNKTVTREEKRREEGYISTTGNSKTTPTAKPKPPSGPANGYAALARGVLEFLNEKTGKAFRPTSSNLDLIVARLREGYTDGQCRQVVVRKARDWLNDDKMAEYLRPATLFNREKFNQYAGELVVVGGGSGGGDG